MRKNPYTCCRDCGHWFWYKETRYSPSLIYGWLPLPQYICMKCSERENMKNCRHPKLIEVDQLTGVAVDIEGQKGNVVGSFQWKKYTCCNCRKLITILYAVVEDIA